MPRQIQLLISEEIAERKIPENDSVRLLDEIVEEMDLQVLYNTYWKRGRMGATQAHTLLK